MEKLNSMCHMVYVSCVGKRCCKTFGSTYMSGNSTHIMSLMLAAWIFHDTKYVYVHIEDPGFAIQRCKHSNLSIRISPHELEATSFFVFYLQNPLPKARVCCKAPDLWTNFPQSQSSLGCRWRWWRDLLSDICHGILCSVMHLVKWAREGCRN